MKKQKDSTKKKVTKVTGSSEIVEQIEEGKVPKLLEMIPEGHSPRVYIELIKEHVMGVDKQKNPRRDEDLLLFLYTAKRTGLDPLANQIHAVFRWNSRIGRETMSIQTGIDGFRLVAQRTGEYAGQDEVVFTPEDEATTYPEKASVTVYKMIQGNRVPFTATARWREYVSTDNKGAPEFMWKKMPYLMLGKCAEALALRKAFPNELSGIYTEDEMSQADNPLSSLPTPERHVKEEPTNATPKVLHGAPESEKDTTVKQIGSEEANQQLKSEAPNLNDDGEPNPKGLLQTKKAKTLAETRRKIKEMQERDRKKKAEEVKENE